MQIRGVPSLIIRKFDKLERSKIFLDHCGWEDPIPKIGSENG